jgi:hypothetical protein
VPALTHVAVAVSAVWLAAPEGEFDESLVTPGALGFAVVLLLGIATWLLLRSMNRHLRKVPRDGREPEPEPKDDEE